MFEAICSGDAENSLKSDSPQAPRKHRHRYHGVFAANHRLRKAVTALVKREHWQARRGRDPRATMTIATPFTRRIDGMHAIDIRSL
jgi:hypothetical protein